MITVLSNYEALPFLEFLNSLSEDSEDIINIDLYKDYALNGYVLNDVKIDVNNDIWDFSSLLMYSRKIHMYRYEFMGDDCKLKYLEKLFIINELNKKGPHVPTIKRENKEIDLYICFLNKINIFDAEKINLKNVREFVEQRSRTISYRNIGKIKRYLELFIKFISLTYKDIYSYDIEKYLNEIDTAKVNRISKENRTKLLSSEFVRNFKQLMKENIDNQYLDIKKRIYASAVYLLIQTGIRSNELVLIPVDPIETVKLNSRKTIYYFHYNSTKNEKNGIRMISMPVNINVVEMIDTVKTLIPDAKEYLFNRMINKDNVTNYFRTECVSNARRLGLVNNVDKWRFFSNKQVKELKNTSNFKKKVMQYDDTDIISIPSIRQLRKYWACDMKKRGYSDIEIFRWMGHTDEKMLGYYGEFEEGPLEDMDFAKSRLKSIIEDNDKILGLRGKQYESDIRKIVSENTNHTLEEIENIILGKKQFRRKWGGFCCKPNIGRPCDYDSATDRFYCAFQMCPNQCHMYYDLSYYIDEFYILIKTYNSNIERNLINATQKELNKIHYLLKSRINPELAELDIKLSAETESSIIAKHPEMKRILDNIKEIRGDIEKWNQKETETI